MKFKHILSFLYQPKTVMLKKILRYLLFAILIFVVLLAIIYIFPKVEAEQSLTETDVMPVRELDSLYWAMQQEVLLQEFGNRKTLIEGYELQCLLALRYFPELKDTRIHFIYRETLIPLASRPDLWTLFGDKTDREYRVIVSNKTRESMEPVLLKNLPFDAQVAILAHELGHTYHYRQYNLWQMLKFGMRYALDGDFRKAHERSTDALVVYRRLGWQLFEYAEYVRTAPKAKAHYEEAKDFLDSHYLQPSEIIEMMSQINAYGLGAPY